MSGILKVRDIFCAASKGVFIISVKHFHIEDADNVRECEGIGHYITYNACTNVLYTNPEVIVLEERDKLDGASRVRELLLKPPIQLHVAMTEAVNMHARWLGMLV